MGEVRLGDTIDDFCIKCKRLTNHAVVSIMNAAAAKVRCRTCYSDHDYRNEIAPPSKRDLKKAALFNQVLSSVAPAGEIAAAGITAGDVAASDVAAVDAAAVDGVPAVEEKPARKKP
jgi:hypothetical protein